MKKSSSREFILNLLEREFGFLARVQFCRFRPYVIAVTGSSGKTTVKYMVGEMLRRAGVKVAVSPENMNTEIGLPLAFLGFARSPRSPLGYLLAFLKAPLVFLLRSGFPDYVVLEYAADKPGDIGYLARIIPPDITVITNVGVAHLEAFGKIENIAREKWQLALSAGDEIICPAEVVRMTRGLDSPAAPISVVGKSTVRALNVSCQTNKTELELEVFGRRRKFDFHFWGEHNIGNLELATLAAMRVVGDFGKIAPAIADLRPQQGRGVRFVGKGDVFVIDESYNANPMSMAAALRCFPRAKLGRKVAILGEMKEIAPIFQKAHAEVAKLAKKMADFTIGVGEGFRDKGLDKWYPNVEELTGELDELVGSGDIVLIKGSLAVALDKIIKKFKE